METVVSFSLPEGTRICIPITLVRAIITIVTEMTCMGSTAPAKSVPDRRKMTWSAAPARKTIIGTETSSTNEKFFFTSSRNSCSFPSAR